MITKQSPSRYYIGEHKPQVQVHIQPVDKYYYQRRKAAEKLNRDEESLNDEPDFSTSQDIDRE